MSRIYNYNDYDKHLSLKFNAQLWLIVLYLLRPYLVLASSFRMGRAGAGLTGVDGLKKLIYPDDLSLTMAILATIPVLLLLFALSRRNPAAPQLVRNIWSRGIPLLVSGTLLNILLVFVPMLTGSIAWIHPVGWVQIGMSLIIIVYLLRSVRVRDTFADFPSENASDDGRHG